ALGEFLQTTRAGHCEYFASATVLLLRAAGVPARYAVGFSVQEWSRLERRWIVRARHAHSWALAYVDGAWREGDTTPPLWAGRGRRPPEPASAWVDRIQAPELRPIVALHYQYRFDPAGLDASARAALRSSAEAWLRDHEDRVPAAPRTG